VLDWYLQELADGHSPDQESYLRRYPELADALRGVFRTLEFVEATSKALDASKLERGQQLGEYRIVREVARGGMGVVYEAIQTSLNRRVALKVLPAGVLLSGSAPERFAREAATAGRLHHTSIVPVYAIGQEQGIHFYAMQYIEGRSLSEHLKRLRQTGTRPGRDYFARVARWGQQAAEALDYAHNEGIVHRDIKPSNLLLDARDNVWITDFGLARIDALTTITVTGDLLGTARYMSPEQARGGRTRIDARTDIYSLGAALYELLGLQPAFDGDSREVVLNQITFADPPPLRRLNPAIPRDLETIVAKCMEKEPDRRYARARDLAEDCRRFLAGESIRARRTPLVVKAARVLRRHRLLALAAVLVLALGTTALVLLVNLRHAQGQRCVDEAYQAILFDEDYGRATRLLDRASALGVDSVELHLYRAFIPLAGYRPREALPHLTRALQLAPGHVESNLALAWAYSMIPDYRSRQRVLDRLPESDIQSGLGWYLHGLILSGTQRSQAIESFNHAIRLRAEFTPAINARAQFRGMRLLTEGAREELDPMLNDYDALVTFRPNSSLSYASRAHGWLNAAAYAATQPDLQAYRDAWLSHCRQDLDQALRLRRPDETLVYVQQANFLRYIGDFRGAEEALRRAIAIKLETAGQAEVPLVHKHAMMVYALGDPAAALREIEPSCAAAPNYYPLGFQHVLMLAELERMEEARRVCRELLERHRTHANAIFIAIVIAELLGDRDAANAAIQELTTRSLAELTSEDGQGTTPGPAVEYLAGRLDAAGLLAAAGDEPGPRCEYAFLIALRALGRGERDQGLAALAICRDTQIIRFLEHHYAQVLLHRAAVDPSWPGWLSVPVEPTSLPSSVGRL
jgi:tetratricopeptide (TPR) repeat protein